MTAPSRRQRRPLHTILPALAFIAALTIGIAATASSAKPDASISHDEAYNRNLTIFNALTRELEENYVDSIRTDEAFEAAIRGMLATVDPYTEYYSYDDKETLTRLTTGSYGGIGSYIQGRDGNTYISEPIVGSPAMKAGLLPGDRILRVDSVDVVGMSSDQTTRLLKGQPGTDVRVTVERPYPRENEDSILTFTLTREKVSEPSVPWSGVIKGDIGYIKLDQFVESSADDVKNALEGFRDNPNVKYVVLDLRNNGGGLVESAISILGNFLPKGTEVLRTRGKRAAEEKIYKTQSNPILPDIPLAVMIDGGSASASEITAGALQDLDRAVLVGTQSFGKGLVQGTRMLPYNALLKVTLAKYYIPSGRLIQALDYSHRNPDGSVARTPDSLTNVYHTAHGREVRDGGGLKPDSIVEWENASALIYGLVVGNHVFDYATRYVATHPAPESPDEISISDDDYEDFVNSIDAATFKYDKLCNQILDQLRRTAESEGYLNEEVKASIDALEKQLDHDLKTDLHSKRPQIENYLTEEIAARYFPGNGRTRRELLSDPGIEVVEKIFRTPGLYESILSAPDSKIKPKK
ncbi:MAG: S41 family peptidase [Muribaculaceae bacterium]|nr:S41 family peptidase [Muribaculaceae bacterium]